MLHSGSMYVPTLQLTDREYRQVIHLIFCTCMTKKMVLYDKTTKKLIAKCQVFFKESTATLIIFFHV